MMSLFSIIDYCSFIVFLIILYFIYNSYTMEDKSNMIRYILILLLIFFFFLTFKYSKYDVYRVPFDTALLQISLLFLLRKNDNEIFFTQKNLINCFKDYLLIAGGCEMIFKFLDKHSIFPFSAILPLAIFYYSIMVSINFFVNAWFFSALYYSTFIFTISYFLILFTIICFFIYCDKKQLTNLNFIDIFLFFVIMCFFLCWHCLINYVYFAF